MDRRAWVSLLPFLAAVVLVAVVGGLAAGNAGAAYARLDQPGWAPPSWLFGPVWTVLYAMIGVSGWLVWRSAGWGPALGAWVVQLVLNLAWTPLFFGADRLGWALVDIVALLVTIVVTIVLARAHSRPAAWLLLPYLAWVGFATALNASLWAAN
jgi:benzodiazapine receptor